MITYPVNVETARFTFKLGGDVRRRQRWPRTDGQAIQNPQPGLVILEESEAAPPAYDPATHKLDGGSWVDDEVNQTAVFTRSAVALSAEESAFQTKETNLSGSVATLRDWATQARATNVTSGNAVATLQTVVNRLGTFFDRFADLLENR